MSNVEERFDEGRTRLLSACERVAAAVRSGDPLSARQLDGVADVLRGSRTWEERASAAASLRGLLHRDGLSDRPSPIGALTWEADLKTLRDGSTIYVESRYSVVAAKHSAAVRPSDA